MTEDDGESCKEATPEPAKSPPLRHVSSYTLRPSVPPEEVREALPANAGDPPGGLSLQCGGQGQKKHCENISMTHDMLTVPVPSRDNAVH